MPGSEGFGFKRISLDNWLTVDPVWTGVFMSYTPPSQPEGFVHDMAQVDLHPGVPLPVRRLFEVARGSLTYSVLFYPLLALGAEQLFRVVESATVHKCEQMNAPEIDKFFQRIEWLRKHKAIAVEEEPLWKEVVELRNAAPHPRDQSIFNLAMTLNVLELTVELVNSLFARR